MALAEMIAALGTRVEESSDVMNMRSALFSSVAVYCSQIVSLLTSPFGFSKTFNDMHLSSFLVCVISDTIFVRQDVLSTFS